MGTSYLIFSPSGTLINTCTHPVQESPTGHFDKGMLPQHVRNQAQSTYKAVKILDILEQDPSGISIYPLRQ
jgi:hypothetical protein